MTQDIIEMAREAGLCYQVGVFPDWIDAGPSEEEIIAFANLVAAKATEEALAQPEQEPVRIMGFNCKCGRRMEVSAEQGVIPAPERTWVGLTEDERDHLEGLHLYAVRGQVEAWIEGVDDFAKAIEAKLKEKNT